MDALHPGGGAHGAARLDLVGAGDLVLEALVQAVGDDRLGVGNGRQVVDVDQLEGDLLTFVQGAGEATVDVVQLGARDFPAEGEEAHGLFAAARGQVDAVLEAGQGAQVDEFAGSQFDVQLFLQFLGGDAGEVAGAVQHAGAGLDEFEVAGGQAGLHGDDGVGLAFADQDGQNGDGAAAGEDDAGQGATLAVGDIGLELDEADAGTEHVHRLDVHVAHIEALAIDLREPVGEGLRRSSDVEVDAGFGGDGDTAGGGDALALVAHLFLQISKVRG